MTAASCQCTIRTDYLTNNILEPVFYSSRGGIGQIVKFEGKVAWDCAKKQAFTLYTAAGTLATQIRANWAQLSTGPNAALLEQKLAAYSAGELAAGAFIIEVLALVPPVDLALLGLVGGVLTLASVALLIYCMAQEGG